MDLLQAIKELREETSLPFTEIKNALHEARGDKEKARAVLTARGATIAEKKSSRSTHEGLIDAYVHSTKKVGVLVELVCETDFVARNPMFVELAHECALHIAAMDPQNIEELLAQPYIKDPAMSVGQLITNAIAKLGENIKIARFVRFAL